MGSGRESLPVTYHIAPATIFGHKRNSNGVFFVEERLMKKLLYGGDGLLGTEGSVYLAFLVFPLGRKLIKRYTSRWVSRTKPRLTSKFMHSGGESWI